MIKVIKIKVVYGWHGEPDGFAPVDKYSFQVLNMFLKQIKVGDQFQLVLLLTVCGIMLL